MKKTLTTCSILLVTCLNLAQANGLRFEKNMEQKVNKLIFKIHNSSTDKSKKYFEKKLKALLEKVKAKKIGIVFPRL